MSELLRFATVTKHLMFSCAHSLNNPKLSQEENIEKFHKCALYKEDGSEEPHGHNYHMEVSIFGTIDSVTGFIIDFKELKKILQNGIVDRLDHRLINNIDYFKDHVTTVENILHYVWSEIEDPINALRPKQAQLVKIKIWETPDSFAELTIQNMEWAKHLENRQGCNEDCDCGKEDK